MVQTTHGSRTDSGVSVPRSAGARSAAVGPVATRSSLDPVPDDATRRSLLDVATTTGDATTTIALAGELDPATAPALSEAIAAAAGDGVTQVDIDLGGITFLDSSGVRVLVSAREQLRAGGVGLSLRNPNPNIRRVLDITGLGEVITIE